MEKQENKNFIIFIFTYYHKYTLERLLTDDEKSNDYRLFEKMEELAEEFQQSGIDNEDEDIEDTTYKFLINKLKEA